MIRRVFGLLGGGAALLTFASCSTFDTGTAATVNGTDITVDQLDAVRDSMAADPTAWQFTDENFDAAGEVDGDLTRSVLRFLIQNEVFADALDSAGVTVTEAQLADATANVESQISSAPEDVRDALATGQAAQAALNDLQAPDPATMEATYEDRPAATGIVCLRAATSTSKDEVESALRAFEDGGAVTATDTLLVDDRCLLVQASDPAADTVVSKFPPAQADVLLSATPGNLLPIVSGSTSASDDLSWQVIQVMHWDDAIDSFGELLAQRPADAAVGGAYARAEVSVSSEYGRWDPLSVNVVALTPAAEGDSAGAA